MHARFLIAAAVLALAAPAQAQPRGPRPDGPPPGEDAGPGGGPQRRLFISPFGEPFRGGGGLEAWFVRTDADHDGALTRPEFRADAVAFFKRLDANHDGRIDGFETQDYERVIAPEITTFSFGGEGRGGRRGGGGPAMRGMPGGGGLQGAARFSLINEPQPVSGADLDLDGKVTLDEWMRAAGRRFDLLDKAQTGRLTRETLPPLPGQAPPPKPGAKP